MKVHLDDTNYEAFLMDYLDGSLDEKEVQELHRFLEDHPELDPEILKSDEVLRLDPPNVTFDGKAAFKRIAPGTPVDRYNQDAYCIAYLEGDLDDFSRRQFEQEIGGNASLQYSFHLYRSSVIKPDDEIVFPAKEQLKRSKIISIRKSLFIPAMAAAAIILIAIGVQWFRGAVTATEELTYSPKMELSLRPMKLDYNTAPVSHSPEQENHQEKDKIVQNNRPNIDKEGDANPDPVHSYKAPAMQPRFHVRNVGRLEPSLKPVPINYNDMVYAAELNIERKALPGRIIDLFKTEVLKMEQPNAMITGWDVAYLGIHTFNRIAGTRLEVTRHYDGENNTKSLAIEPQLFRQEEEKKNNEKSDN